MSVNFIDHHLAKSTIEVTKANTADEVWKLEAAPEVLGSCESPVEAVEAGVVVVVVVGFNARHSEALVEPLHMLSKTILGSSFNITGMSINSESNGQRALMDTTNA